MNTPFDSDHGRWALLVATLLATGASTLSTVAIAQRHGRAAAPGWHGNISHFQEHDWGLWRAGRWTHQRHDGHLGWWWVASGVWYPYPWPVYPYPNPWEPPVVVTPPVDTVPPVPPTQYWYLCEGSNTYYPYVATCPGGWKQVPALPANAPTAPSK